jgi:hypothetical protein
VKTAQREASCGGKCDDEFTVEEEAKQRPSIREEGGNKSKKKKKIHQREASPCDENGIPDRTESKGLTVREDHASEDVRSVGGKDSNFATGEETY